MYYNDRKFRIPNFQFILINYFNDKIVHDIQLISMILNDDVKHYIPIL
jgi:hypothetical protein